MQLLKYRSKTSCNKLLIKKELLDIQFMYCITLQKNYILDILKLMLYTLVDFT